jgi:hypothetical protein
MSFEVAEPRGRVLRARHARRRVTETPVQVGDFDIALQLAVRVQAIDIARRADQVDRGHDVLADSL